MTQSRYITSATFGFLRDLARNNNRPWFQENKRRYEEQVRDPAIRFITDFAPHLRKISPHFRADPRPVGGSLFRIHKDTRFSKDKSPYKRNTGIHFRHALAKDAHCPGFYLHLEPGSIFTGVGLWRPDAAATARIREAVDADRTGWKRAAHGRRFRETFDLAGDSLTRPPRGYDADHPLIDDLKRKDFVGVARLSQRDVTSPDFMKHFTSLCRDGAPLVKFLCRAVGVPF